MTEFNEQLPDKNASPTSSALAEKNYTLFVFDESLKDIDPHAPGFNRVFSFIGNVVVEGNIPSNSVIISYGGAIVVRAQHIGNNVKISSIPLDDKKDAEKLKMWRNFVEATTVEEHNLISPPEGFSYTNTSKLADGTEEREEIKIRPLDVYVESKFWEDRSSLENAFKGDVIGVDLTIISAGSVLFNGNTPPHTVISTKTGACYISGSTGAVSMLNIGGADGTKCAALGEVSTLSSFGKVVIGEVSDNCTISASGEISIYNKIGKNSVITAKSGVNISGEFIESLSENERTAVLSRITSSGKIKTLEGKALSNNQPETKEIEFTSSSAS